MGRRWFRLVRGLKRVGRGVALWVVLPVGVLVGVRLVWGWEAGRRLEGVRASDCANGIEVDPDYLEHLRQEAQGQQLDLPWEA